MVNAGGFVRRRHLWKCINADDGIASGRAQSGEHGCNKRVETHHASGKIAILHQPSQLRQHVLQSGVGGQGHLTAASQDKGSDDAQGKLRQTQTALGRWQQSLADLIPSPSGRLDAETVR